MSRQILKMLNPSGPLAAETAHTLFLDIVGYTRLPLEAQSRLAGFLREVVRNTAEYRRALVHHALISLDLGDGMALVFFDDPLSPVKCAAELMGATHAVDGLSLRMGIHSGPVTRVRDLHGRDNVSGPGINIAQRVMECASPDQILLSDAAADLLRQFQGWSEALEDLGEHIVKHGDSLHLYRLVMERLPPPETLWEGVPGGAAAQVATATSLQPDFSYREVGTAAPVLFAGARSGSMAPLAALEQDELEPVSGAVSLESRFYIERPTDAALSAAIARRDTIVLIKGARQMGKTSLLARGLLEARMDGARTLLSDFQTLNNQHFATVQDLYRGLMELLLEQMDLQEEVDAFWLDSRGPNMNLERFVRRVVLADPGQHVVWGLDEVDRLFTCPYGSEVFGLFRSWHNRRSLDPEGPWSRLTMVIAYATEAHLFITDINQSPFNVGTRLELRDFTREEAAELNRRYGSPITSARDEAALYELLNGQPYLTQCALRALATRRLTWDRLIRTAGEETGPFGDHLRRLLVSLTQDAGLTAAVRGLLNEGRVKDPELFYRLRAAGVLSGESGEQCDFRCSLYRQYLSRNLPA